MRLNKNFNYHIRIFTLLFFFYIGQERNIVNAQDDKPLRLYLDLACFQKKTGIDLKATVRARIGENRKIMPVEGLDIDFYNLTDSSEMIIGTSNSNENGEAILTIEEYKNLHWDQDEGYRFQAMFKGSEKFRRANKNLSIRKATIDITFIEIDSIKMIAAHAYEVIPEVSERIPLEDITVSFYVPGSFSLFRIGEEELEKGVCSVNFPVTLPGDAEGNLTIIAKIEESDDYGFVESTAIKNWGAIKEPVLPEVRRGLGDTDAPLWMVYTLIFLLSAVWVHYLYVFVVIYLIKKDSKVIK